MTFMGSGWGLRKKEVDAMGHTVESGSKAQLGLGITVPYKYNSTKYLKILLKKKFKIVKKI